MAGMPPENRRRLALIHPPTKVNLCPSRNKSIDHLWIDTF